MVRLLSVTLCFAYGLLCLPTALAAPTSATSSLVKRQDGTPVTVVTEDTIQGSSGPITETCTVTLTPISVNGQTEFREEKSCTQAPASSNNNNSPSAASPVDSSNNSPTSTQQAASATDTSVATSTTDSTDVAQQATSVTASSAAPTDSTDPLGQSSAAAISSSLAAPTDVQVIGASSASTDIQPTASVNSASASASTSALATSSDSVSATATATTSIGSSAIVPTDVAVLGPSSMPAASASAAAAAALASSSTAAAPSTSGTTAAFAIPGKQIQVLPIGLGVFAGVSVIALIVVGLVTYERTKYRRKFRKDKLAEAGASAGYGGMAERR